MHTKHTASELKAMALCGAVSACEMRAFSARHAGTLDATSHVDFVEAFVLQLGHSVARHTNNLEVQVSVR